MSREILFKAKILNSDEWVEGSLLQGENSYIISAKEMHHSVVSNGHISCCLDVVDPNTLCQFTNLTDKNGVKIFEGDILGGVNGSINGYPCQANEVTVVFRDGKFNVPLWGTFEKDDYSHYLEVIGNIHNQEK